MTAQDKNTLKARFETGDTPGGSDYADLIDSTLNPVESSPQSLSSSLYAPVVTAGSVVTGVLTVASGATIGDASITNTLSVATIIGGAARVTGVLSGATGVFSGALTGGSIINLGSYTMVSAQTAVTASAGGVSTAPATVAKYLKIIVSGVTYNIPMYK